ncbi:MAG TPA: c-type cytochrome [Candidatus Binatia bacterium]|nr:c-type cytochrome [Candidatus Binatia bacterium]
MSSSLLCMEKKGSTVRRDKRRVLRLIAATAPALLAGGFLAIKVYAGANGRVPSNVTFSPETAAAAASGDAFRGMLLARRCAHCHGDEGFSPVAATPNLAGMDRLTNWKQLQDFRDHKRSSRVMEPIAASLSTQDMADVVAYYARLPVFVDFQDNRAFPQAAPSAQQAEVATRLVSFGDGERGIPPCQACHGPVAYRPGAPALMTQNGDYLLQQLEAFANGGRTNDINESMRVITSLLTESEKQALARYYGGGLGAGGTMAGK